MKYLLTSLAAIVGMMLFASTKAQAQTNCSIGTNVSQDTGAVMVTVRYTPDSSKSRPSLQYNWSNADGTLLDIPIDAQSLNCDEVSSTEVECRYGLSPEDLQQGDSLVFSGKNSSGSSICGASALIYSYTGSGPARPDGSKARNTSGEDEGFGDTLLDRVNPLNMANLKAEGVALDRQLSTPGAIISRVLFFAFPLAGLILFVMIFWGGFEVLMMATSKKSVDAGKQRITAAVIGFLLLFVSYWLVELLGAIFGINIF